MNASKHVQNCVKPHKKCHKATARIVIAKTHDYK